jgi:hypothetical protein
LAGIVLAELPGPDILGSSAAVAAYAGLNPQQRQSGISVNRPAHMNNTPTPPYKSPPRTTSTVFEMGSQEKTQAPVATYIAMTAGTKTESWIIMAGHSSKV